VRYYIRHFFAPWGYVLSGSIDWQGDSKCNPNGEYSDDDSYPDDVGNMTIYDNDLLVTPRRGQAPPWNHFNFTRVRFAVLDSQVRRAVFVSLLVLHRKRVCRDVKRIIVLMLLQREEDWLNVYPQSEFSMQNRLEF
jgi:hypothetical protein